MKIIANYRNRASRFVLLAARAQDAEITAICMRVALAYEALIDAYEALARLDGAPIEELDAGPEPH